MIIQKRMMNSFFFFHEYIAIQEIQAIQPAKTPLAAVQIFIDEHSPLISISAFFETGAAQTIANPLVMSQVLVTGLVARLTSVQQKFKGEKEKMAQSPTPSFFLYS